MTLYRTDLEEYLKDSIRRINSAASLDLHVLSTPPAFILSQDQTL